MPTIVRSGGGGGADISALTNAATINEVLEGHQFYGAGSEDPQTGTIKNNGAVTETAPYNGSGYYSSITINTIGNASKANVLSGKTFMNKDGAQTGTMTNYGAATIELTGTTNKGYYSSITVNKTPLGTAKAEHVLSTVTFTNNNGSTQNGTMVNRGAFTKTVGVGDTQTGSAGYYSSITVTGPTFSESTGTNAQILSGIKFYSNNGTLMNGTMTNRGSVTCTSLAAGTTCAPGAGYYSCISIKAAAAPTLNGTATNATVLSGYTFYNTSTSSQMKGTYVPPAAQVCTKTVSVNMNWDSTNIGFVPSYYAIGYSSGDFSETRWGIKHYMSGTRLYFCEQGTNKTLKTARIVAYA